MVPGGSRNRPRGVVPAVPRFFRSGNREPPRGDGWKVKRIKIKPRGRLAMAGKQIVRVWRPTPSEAGRVVIWLPYARGTRGWLRSVCGTGTRPEFDRARKAWTVARPHFRRIVQAVADRYGSVDVYVDHTVRHACGAMCRNAEGDDCQCSCLGDNHGNGRWHEGWQPVGDEWVVRNERVRRRFRVGAAGEMQQVG